MGKNAAKLSTFLPYGKSRIMSPFFTVHYFINTFCECLLSKAFINPFAIDDCLPFDRDYFLE